MGWKWTVEDREHVAELLLAGKSMGVIAKLLGMTRNMVIGRIHRDGSLHTFVGKVVINKKIDRDRQNVKPKPKKPNPLPPVVATKAPPRSPFACVPEPRQEMAVPDIVVVGVPLLELAHHSCRFPVEEKAEVVGKFLFCGRRRASDHTNYCARHFHVVHPDAERRRARLQ